MAYINFYLDRPFDTTLSKDNVQQIINDCKNAKKHYPRSILNDKQTSLYLFFTYDTRKRIKIKTQIKVVAEDWDFFRGKYKYTRKGSLEMNNELDSLSHTILKQFTRLAEDNPHYQEADVKQLLLKTLEINKEVPLSQLFKATAEFSVAKEQLLTQGTLKEYKTIFKSLKNFEDNEGKALTFLSFNQAFFDKYEKFLINKKHPYLPDESPQRGLLNDTIAKYTGTLRSFLQWAYYNNYHKNIGAFTNIKTQIKKKSKNEVVALTEEELQSVMDLDLSGNTRLERVRDQFCFGCYTGQRFSDIMRFNKEDFDGKKWSFISFKVKKRVVVPFAGFIANALPIAIKYNYQFPEISNQKFNSYLKEIGELAKIDHSVKITRFTGLQEVQIRKQKFEYMASHMARRTFVTIMLEKGVPITVIQKITQHRDIRTLMKYESHGENALFESLKKT